MFCKGRPFHSSPLKAMWFETTALKRVKHWQPSTWNTRLYLPPADLWLTYLICDFPLTCMCARYKTDRPAAAEMWTLSLGLGLSVRHAIRPSRRSWAGRVDSQSGLQLRLFLQGSHGAAGGFCIRTTFEFPRNASQGWRQSAREISILYFLSCCRLN